ncbi:Type I restriction-modification system methyltransferase subunit [Burkholderia pseudomallei]|uniref:hypothetical protein n=1 Tax=Burkholderia pseudomallei TaxID=28450 RepID=UPI000975E1F0|nr:hypothetical protein [Burkholderia pseudomallei]MBF4045256.1 hypothetical protein [Burkholderia pseudomallei]OMU05134.1 hypothetical protein AQ768_02690 [Burkholderia pseudomallei]CAJ3545198.1 putative type I restriction-modification system methyltransferase subunit [Burkholderia pseudomallei]CAJ4986975.1 putative type I restriction-modification system methyltransferase subunit [Burkholderia pseudomallei]CAJ5304367.1 putative type I restriction-modification system methyltransferase subunit 
MAPTSSSQPLFPPGRIIMTVGVDELIKTGQLNPYPYLFRHLRGDWGDLCNEDRRRNDAAMNSDARLFSEYKVSPSLTLWIITESDRSVTTVLLPKEY